MSDRISERGESVEMLTKAQQATNGLLRLRDQFNACQLYDCAKDVERVVQALDNPRAAFLHDAINGKA